MPYGLLNYIKYFKKKNGEFYHTELTKIVENFRIILFEVYLYAGTFITSDNPAFRYIFYVEITNINEFFPD